MTVMRHVCWEGCSCRGRLGASSLREDRAAGLRPQPPSLRSTSSQSGSPNARDRHDTQIVIRTSAARRAAVDAHAKAAGKSRADFVRDLLNEGWRRRYENDPVVLNIGDWQPIETAPRDGTPLILAPHMMIGWWEFGDNEWMLLQIPLNEDRTIQEDWSKPIKLFYCLYANVAGVEPTHWLPCPMPPASDFGSVR